jgi:hypothetical protein
MDDYTAMKKLQTLFVEVLGADMCLDMTPFSGLAVELAY